MGWPILRAGTPPYDAAAQRRQPLVKSVLSNSINAVVAVSEATWRLFAGNPALGDMIPVRFTMCATSLERPRA